MFVSCYWLLHFSEQRVTDNMSSRALRKLQHNKDRVDVKLPGGSEVPVPDGSSDIADVEDDDSNDTPTIKTKSSNKSAPQNLFALVT